MSKAYRVERELMVSGQTVPTFRVIVKLGQGWGRVQCDLSKQDAEDLCKRLLDNEAKSRERLLTGSQPFSSPAYLSHRRRR